MDKPLNIKSSLNVDWKKLDTRVHTLWFMWSWKVDKIDLLWYVRTAVPPKGWRCNNWEGERMRAFLSAGSVLFFDLRGNGYTSIGTWKVTSYTKAYVLQCL